MTINAIKTDVQDATYVEAARWGKHRGWRYVLGLVVIFFVGLVVGGIATPRIAFLFGGQEGLATFRRLDYAAFGPVGASLRSRQFFRSSSRES
jgi:hypothetical protein